MLVAPETARILLQPLPREICRRSDFLVPGEVLVVFFYVRLVCLCRGETDGRAAAGRGGQGVRCYVLKGAYGHTLISHLKHVQVAFAAWAL